jgi:hypothetical protein
VLVVICCVVLGEVKCQCMGSEGVLIGGEWVIGIVRLLVMVG